MTNIGSWDWDSMKRISAYKFTIKTKSQWYSRMNSPCTWWSTNKTSFLWRVRQLICTWWSSGRLSSSLKIQTKQTLAKPTLSHYQDSMKNSHSLLYVERQILVFWMLRLVFKSNSSSRECLLAMQVSNVHSWLKMKMAWECRYILQILLSTEVAQDRTSFNTVSLTWKKISLTGSNKIKDYHQQRCKNTLMI